MGWWKIALMDRRDWLDWVVDVAQVVGAVVGVVAIVLAAWSIVSAKRQVTRERRLDFELTTLKELAQQPAIINAIRVGLTAVLGPAIVPMACAFVQHEATPEMVALFDAQTREGMSDEIGSGDSAAKILRTEVIEQIRVRVAARG